MRESIHFVTVGEPAPAGYNDWTIKRHDHEIDGYAVLFAELVRPLEKNDAESSEVIPSR